MRMSCWNALAVGASCMLRELGNFFNFQWHEAHFGSIASGYGFSHQSVSSVSRHSVGQ